MRLLSRKTKKSLHVILSPLANEITIKGTWGSPDWGDSYAILNTHHVLNASEWRFFFVCTSYIIQSCHAGKFSLIFSKTQFIRYLPHVISNPFRVRNLLIVTTTSLAMRGLLSTLEVTINESCHAGKFSLIFSKAQFIRYLKDPTKRSRIILFPGGNKGI